MERQVIKVAATYQQSNTSFLGEIDLSQPLTAFITTLCEFWKLSNPEHYGLQFSENPKHYVSENNKNRIRNGVIMMLVSSVVRHCEMIIKQISSGGDLEKEKALQILAEQCTDPLVATQTINMKGLDFLIKAVEEDKFSPKVLPNALYSFSVMMEQGTVSWDLPTPLFIKKVVSFINSQSQTDPQLVETALIILESIVINSQENYSVVEKNVTLPNILRRITNSSVEIQTAVLALINALFQRSDSVKRKYYFSTLTARTYRNIFTNHIFPLIDTNKFSSDMQHQLYISQQLLLNQYEEKLLTPVEINEKNQSPITELRLKAFEDRKTIANCDSKSHEIRNDFKKLGFSDDINPANDFKVPPGMLALDNMIYFARGRSEQYAKLVLENSCRGDSHECPFALASIELTNLLADILKIGEIDLKGTFYPMIFSHDHFLEELFSICIGLFNKTWKEMRATQEDFAKVVSVVRDQIERTLTEVPKSLDRFNEAINKLTYSDISEIWQKERLHHEEKEMQAPAIKELRNQIEPEILQLVHQNRLNFLIDGSIFKHKAQKGLKEKNWYCRLSANHKCLHYGDCDEKSKPTIDELKNKISVADIRDFLTGRDCPHKKEKAGKKYAEFYAFSLILDTGDVSEVKSLDFLTPDENIYNYWIDGINVLLRRRLTSKSAEQELNLLLNMEMKLRILHLEGIPIPYSSPTIPSPPDDYNFYYQTS